jgi:hypothetical protein
MGSIGVAFNSTILSVRADGTVGASCGKSCFFSDEDLANGIEYAINHGAKVINLSLGGSTPDDSTFLQALSDAVAKGVVFTISAGNDGSTDPEWPARYAADPRFAGSIIAVGSIDQTRALSSFSDMAGVAASEYLAAPGENIAANCTSAGCVIVSGTSFSAPHVAGALALLLQAFPNLTGPKAVDILFKSADDAGAAGTDPVYGRGILNLARAFQPIGTLAVPTQAGGTVSATGSGAATSTGLAFGARFGAGALLTIGHDSYQRLFEVDLAQVYRPRAVGGLIGPAPPVLERAATMTLPGGGRLSVATQRPIAAAPDQSADGGTSLVWDPSSTTFAFDKGGLSLVSWTGRGGAAAPAIGGPRDAFQNLAAPDRVLEASWRLGHWAISGEQGWSRRVEPFQVQPSDASSYSRLTASYASHGLLARIAVGHLAESLGPLGSYLPQGSPFAIPARSTFSSLSLEALAGPVFLYGQASLGRTSFAGQFLRMDGALSSAWRVGMMGDCGLLRIACSRFTLELAQPLRIESGSVSATLASPPAHYFDPVIFTDRRFAASPDGREMILSLTADRDFARWGVVSLSALAAADEGHRSGAPLGLGAQGAWRFAF